MARLPQVGGDDGNWGSVLNEFLLEAHTLSGTLKPGSVGSSEVADGSLPSSKLSASVRASLAKADAAISTSTANSLFIKTVNGIPADQLGDVSVDSGPQGPQGVQGSQGPQGSQGAQGLTGAQGTTGAQGATGSQGAQGATGTQGSQGFQGLKGDTGNTGAQGPQGTQGADGGNGAQGAQGAQGIAGSNGAQGAQGFQGITGTPGSQGAQGAQGSQGFQGNQGFQGFQGTTGTTGTGVPTAGSTGQFLAKNSATNYDTAWVNPAFASVTVSTGSETRPTATFVMWVGGTTQPTNMAIGDVWMKAS